MFDDITSDLRALMPELRGRLIANASLADITWFRVGGPAQIFSRRPTKRILPIF